MSTTRVTIAVLVVLVLAGCARPILPARPQVGRPGTGPAAPPGRILVVARQPVTVNRGIGDRAADLLAQGLRPAGEVWTFDDVRREATVVGAAPWAANLADHLATGGWPTVDDRMQLLKFAVTGIVVSEVTAYEQVWGKYAKFTRVGVEARGFDVAAGGVVWRLHRGVEVEDVRGRAFDYAIESAVAAVVAAIYPGTPFTVVDLWRGWRR